jgi:radical SAM protein with 4Fe4S-binding SPASM domain
MTECSIDTEGFDALFERIVKEKGQRRIPVTGTIEVTPYCNMKCAHCYVTHCNWQGSILNREEVFRILDEITEEGCIWLLFTGGEPLLRDDFIDIYTYAKKKGIFTIIFTNGTLITPEIARYFHDCPPRLVEISIYGATKSTHDSITGVPGSFERCLKGIELLLEQGIRLKLKTMVLSLNKHEYWEMKELAQGLGVPFRLDPMLNPGLDGSRHPYDLRLSPEEVVKFDLEDPERRDAWIRSYQHLSRLRAAPETVYICGAGTKQFHIDALGRLQTCTVARQPSYDLRQGSFHEGWHTFLSNVVSQKLSQPSPCRACQYRNTCPVCTGLTQLEYGTPEEKPIEYLCQVERLRAKHFNMTTEAVGNVVADNENALNRPLG